MLIGVIRAELNDITDLEFLNINVSFRDLVVGRTIDLYIGEFQVVVTLHIDVIDEKRLQWLDRDIRPDFTCFQIRSQLFECILEAIADLRVLGARLD